MKKTNVMRILDKAKIPYSPLEYEYDESDLSGVHIAKSCNMDCSVLFKTLVAKGDKSGFAVFCIPCDKELDLKKAAKASQNKSVELLHLKDLLPVTGYIRGGCSPIGMKKKFPTYIHSSAQNLDKISVSGGLRGTQVILSPQALAQFTDADFCDLIAFSQND